LFRRGLTTAEQMAASMWSERCRILARSGYARYDESTSRKLGAPGSSPPAPAGFHSGSSVPRSFLGTPGVRDACPARSDRRPAKQSPERGCQRRCQCWPPFRAPLAYGLTTAPRRSASGRFPVATRRRGRQERRAKRQSGRRGHRALHRSIGPCRQVGCHQKMLHLASLLMLCCSRLRWFVEHNCHQRPKQPLRNCWSRRVSIEASLIGRPDPRLSRSDLRTDVGAGARRHGRDTRANPAGP
jgi:hypothetical protein